MNSKILLASLTLLSLPGAGLAIPAARAEPGSLAAKANAQAERVSDVDAFLEEIELALAMAHRGEYGPLKRGDFGRMSEAQELIRKLLQGHSRATELAPADRIALYNAQELITSTLRSDEKNRKICKRAPTTGSRLTKTECMTVAQREARARAGGNLVWEFQAHICNPQILSSPTIPGAEYFRACDGPGP